MTEGYYILSFVTSQKPPPFSNFITPLTAESRSHTDIGASEHAAYRYQVAGSQYYGIYNTLTLQNKINQPPGKATTIIPVIMSEEHSKPFANEDDDERHRREEAERRAKRKVSLLLHRSCWLMLVDVGSCWWFRLLSIGRKFTHSDC